MFMKYLGCCQENIYLTIDYYTCYNSVHQTGVILIMKFHFYPIFLLFLLLVSCSLNDTATNTAPVVSISEGDVIVSYGVEQMFTAIASDADGDSLSYQWYVDGVLQANETSSTFSITREPDQQTMYEIIVIVSDGNSTVEDEVTLTVNTNILGVNIIVELPELQPIHFDGQVLTLQSGEVMTVSLSPSTDVDIDYYIWYVDLDIVSEGPTSNSITFGDTLEPGIHKLTIQILINGFLYSEELIFTVAL